MKDSDKRSMTFRNEVRGEGYTHYVQNAGAETAGMINWAHLPTLSDDLSDIRFIYCALFNYLSKQHI